MPSIEQLRNRLIVKLQELFQLDQPDLDFGFYRIMHSKAEQINKFVNEDLLETISEAFSSKGYTSVEKLVELKKKITETLGESSIDSKGKLEPTYAGTPLGKQYLELLENTGKLATGEGAEAEVYDHLYRFFERYYEGGDFVSRRYFVRENAGRAAPYAIPYNGEEVKLHWANADQYYIKTAEYFNNFSFDLKRSKEFEGMTAAQQEMNLVPDGPQNVHFRIVEATEGEHGNVKASEDTKRYFVIHESKPVELNEAGELQVNFEYRADPEKTGTDDVWRKKRNEQAHKKILDQLDSQKKENKRFEDYLNMFMVVAPTEKEKTRTVLAKYINQYTARNSMDYFIHKDLGGFLRRELDFYIKNEVMRLDDIENADAPAVESYLDKIRIIRKIAGKLIDFLAQLEDFQKKLWLKKKFVVETNYCITLDRIPEEFYPEIAANKAQHDEWIRLFAIDEIKPENGDLIETAKPGYSNPLTVDFLKANNKLVIDTALFSDEFKQRLLASIDNLDENCDGLLIHSENFQALNLVQERYREQVKCVYIDPPYNTGGDGFSYKDGYKHSSWLSLILQTNLSALSLLSKDSIQYTHIDENEVAQLRLMLDSVFGPNNFQSQIAWKNKYGPGAMTRGFGNLHESVLVYSKSPINSIEAELSEEEQGKYNQKDEKFSKRGGFVTQPLATKSKDDRPNLVYPICYSGEEIWPDKQWIWGKDRMEKALSKNEIVIKKTGDKFSVRFKQYLKDENGKMRKAKPLSLLLGPFNQAGTSLIEGLFGSRIFSFPKPYQLASKLLNITLNGMELDHDLFLDYFSGSGTTGHAVINLNREDQGKRKYILVEMGDYFDTVLKPRIQKVVYSKNWKNGKPVVGKDENDFNGISHCFKYIRLESYEDTLNNLEFKQSPMGSKLMKNASLKEDYLLNYLLEVETKGSQSLLSVESFLQPDNYQLKVKKPGSDEYALKNVDLLETFNFLIGLRVIQIDQKIQFNAAFKREKDPELPTDQHTKLVTESGIKKDDNGKWWFRKVVGWVPKDRMNPNESPKSKVLIIWRNLTEDLEQDNLMLDEWFNKNRINTRDFEFDTIYVNGSNNLPNLKKEDDNWKVVLIEDEFHKRMWENEGGAVWQS